MNYIFNNDVNFKIGFAIIRNKTVVNKRDITRKNIQKATEELADYFQDIPSNIDEIFNCLRSHLRRNPTILGSGFAFSPEIRTCCPFVHRGINGLESKDIGQEFCYTNTVWYDVALKQRKAVWSVPYFDIGKAGEDILLTTYSIPLYNKNSRIMGVLISDLLLAKLEEIPKIEKI